ncbi:MAG: pilus (MSHA type) biogenesis protein MshL [Pseudomonadota bacterium]
MIQEPTRYRAWASALALLLAGCGTTPPKDGTTYDKMLRETDRALERRPPAGGPDAVSDALLPPLTIEVPNQVQEPMEQRFDLAVTNAPAEQVFMAVVSGSRYSMLVHPEVKGTLSVNLKNVTVLEALEAIRDVYGYDFRVTGNRIFVEPLTLRSKVYRINFLAASRSGTSEVFVSSSAIQGSGPGTTLTPTTTTTTSGVTGPRSDASRITTRTDADFWRELREAITAIAGTGEGRTVVVSPQSGVVVVKAMPAELKSVDAFLKASRVNVERQVMLEAKILEVQLRDGYEAGVNWSAFNRGSGAQFSFGQLGPASRLSPLGGPPLVGGNLGTADASGTVTGVSPGSDLAALDSAAGTLFGLALRTSNFAVLLDFLETQGNLHVLSSPRIATLNNQKAVLKVGQDELFVTNVSSTTTTGTATTTTPTVTLQSFFSGIALDVTPSINDDGTIALHIHPQVSETQQIQRQIDLGSNLGLIQIPVPSTRIRETDSIVKVQDGQIVALGGLMAEAQTEDRSGVPGLAGVPYLGSLFRQTQQISDKRELVILLKPTIIKGDKDWADDLKASDDRLKTLDRGFSWGSKSDVFGTKGESGPPPWQAPVTGGQR